MKLTNMVFTRIWWLGRGTATIMGLAVMLAVVLGVGTTALAAVPGDPFRLGRINAVDAASGLVGSVNGAMLTIENKSPGSKGAPAPALSLKVAAGNPPLNVNPEAGTAAGLSADELDGKDSGQFLAANGKAKNAFNADFASFAGDAQNAQIAADSNNLDGKDSTSFANGTNGKANNANLLDGKDSSEFVSSTIGTAPNANHLDGQDSTRFFSGKTYSVENSSLGPGDGGITSRIALCDEGDNVLGGGGGSFADEPILDSFPLGSRSWFVSMRDDFGPSEIRATALCADFPPMR
jgi:hypothetical protein